MSAHLLGAELAKVIGANDAAKLGARASRINGSTQGIPCES